MPRHRLRALLLSSLGTALVVVATAPLIGLEPQGLNTKISPPVSSGPLSIVALEPASEMTISVTARVTFRDGATAARRDSGVRGWSPDAPEELDCDSRKQQ